MLVQIIVVRSIGPGLLLLDPLEKGPESLHTSNQCFLRRMLSVNNVYVLKNLMGLAMNYVNFCVKIILHLMDRNPT